jgi:hypothetical protein
MVRCLVFGCNRRRRRPEHVDKRGEPLVRAVWSTTAPRSAPEKFSLSINAWDGTVPTNDGEGLSNVRKRRADGLTTYSFQ